MYEAHFGLEDRPFHIAPDLRFYVDSVPHRAAFDALRGGLKRGDEFMLLSGDFGSGKTTVGRRLLEDMGRAGWAVAEITAWGFEGDDLLRRIAVAFGVPESDTILPLGSLVLFLQELAGNDRQALLMIDEAHSLGFDALRCLKKLTAVSVDGRGVLHVCLVGRSPPTDFKEHSRPRKPLGIGTVVQLGALDAAETDSFILSRLRRAGWTGSPSFAAGATTEIHARCEGNPGRINRLCGHLLEHLSGNGETVVGVEMVRAVEAQLESELDGEPDASWIAPATGEHGLAQDGSATAAPVRTTSTASTATAESTVAGNDEVPQEAAIAPAAAPGPSPCIADAAPDGVELEPVHKDFPAHAPPAFAALPALLRVPSDGALVESAPGLAWPPAVIGPVPPARGARRHSLLQATAAILLCAGGVVAWQNAKAPGVGGLIAGRAVAPPVGQGPVPVVAAPHATRPAAPPAAPAPAPPAGPAAMADAAQLMLQQAPTAAGGSTPAAAEPAAAVAEPRNVAAAADRARKRWRPRGAPNEALDARAAVATVACSLEAQAMGLCNRAPQPQPQPQPQVQVQARQEPAPATVQEPAEGPRQRPACTPTQTTLGLCAER